LALLVVVPLVLEAENEQAGVLVSVTVQNAALLAQVTVGGLEILPGRESVVERVSDQVSVAAVADVEAPAEVWLLLAVASGAWMTLTTMVVASVAVAVAGVVIFAVAALGFVPQMMSSRSMN